MECIPTEVIEHLPISRTRSGVATLVLAGVLLNLACSKPESPNLGLAGLDSSAWVSIYEPERAWNGYTLAFFRQRIPILMDMNGRIVHAWPEARTKSRIRLLEDGSLLAIMLGRGVVQYDWDGRLVWQYRPQSGFAHHDVIRLANGNTVLLVKPGDRATDIILEVDPEGEVVWEWDSRQHLAEFFSDSGRKITHINSVQELPPNPWHRRGDQRFLAGNLLISARAMDSVFLIDKQTKRVVWSFQEGLDRQHEALLVEPGMPGHPNLLIFNNRFRSFSKDRKSAIIEVDPHDRSIVWEYRADGFYSPSMGLEQPLANGNILVASSRGGRAFEITRGGEIVWEWTPPFDPVRPQRYSYDHCPQLASLVPPEEKRVLPAADYRYIDNDVYRFARRKSRRSMMVNGKATKVLKSNNDCRKMILPAAASVRVAYGLEPLRLERSGRSDYAARFRLLLRDEQSGEEILLLEDSVDLDGPTRGKETIGLDRYANRKVRLCIETEEIGAPIGTPTEEFAFWVQPAIGTRTLVDWSEEDLLEGLTEEELEVRKQHLKALGYVN